MDEKKRRITTSIDDDPIELEKLKGFFDAHLKLLQLFDKHTTSEEKGKNFDPPEEENK